MLSVVVCTYNRAALLAQVLESLSRQTIAPEQMEVIVVDNNSQDETADIAESLLAQFKNHQFLHEPRQGLSYARNRGWQAASGKYIAFLDDDAKANPDWCERIVSAFASVSPAPVAVGGPIYPWYEIPPPSWFSDDFEIRTWGNDVGYLPESRARFGFSGSNMTFPKKILEKYQGFNHTFGMVGGKLGLGEEAELFSRIFMDEPYFWYDPSIKVLHWVPIRNMKIYYRLVRMYKSGRTRALIERQQVVQKNIAQEFIHLLVFFKDLILVPVRPKQNKKVMLVNNLRRVFYQVGYLFG
jgi:glycosyltransferase involved in cell wall biosynthesis